MAVQFPIGLAPVLSQVYQSGAEVTLRQLGELLGESGDILTIAGAVDIVTAQLELELLPTVHSGGFDTVRVLRRRAIPETSLERVHRIASRGEGTKIEYKSSMLCSMHHWTSKKTLQELDSLPGEILKTICAFLNTEGGDLLVGVDDNGEVCEGVAKDLEIKKWDLDKWQLHLTSLIVARFHRGEELLPYIQMSAVPSHSFPVIHIEVLRREQCSFVQKAKDKPHEFFSRTGSRTDTLSLPAFYSYLEARSAR